MGLRHERREGSIALARTYQQKQPSKIRARYRQRCTQNLMMACELWRRSLRFERISESRRPRFEPDIDNVPHENLIFTIAMITITNLPSMSHGYHVE